MSFWDKENVAAIKEEKSKAETGLKQNSVLQSILCFSEIFSLFLKLHIL